MLSATVTATTTTQSKSTQRLLPADVRWCLDNKDDLSLVSYVDHFALASRRYAVRRYKHIIKRNIPKEDRRRLLSELKFFTKTVRYYQYWYDIMQKKVALKAKLRSTRILDASTKQQAKSLLTTFRGKSSTTSSSSSSNHITTDDDDDDEGDAVDVDLTTEDSLQDASSVDENHATSSSPPQAPSSSDHSENYEFDSEDSCCLKHTKKSDGSSRGCHNEGDKMLIIKVGDTGFFI